MSGFFTLLLLVCLVGAVRPFRGFKRKHFGLAAIAAFIGIGAFMPPPTPQEIAARKVKEAEKAREEAEEARREAQEQARAEAQKKADADREQAAERKAEHDRIVEKASPALEVPSNYTRSEYRQTYARVGAASFAQLNRLEPGAAYAAAESRSCDRVVSAMVSDTSRQGRAMWFVDCQNGDRFMVEQAQAAEALRRFEEGKLVRSELARSCTIDTVALCKSSPAQKKAVERELEFVSNCDILLQEALVSPSSLDMRGRWRMDFGKGDTVTFRRAFDSQNAFGATLRAQYRCDVDASSGRISRFEISGPMGKQRVL